MVDWFIFGAIVVIGILIWLKLDAIHVTLQQRLTG